MTYCRAVTVTTTYLTVSCMLEMAW